MFYLKVQKIVCKRCGRIAEGVIQTSYETKSELRKETSVDVEVIGIKCDHCGAKKIAELCKTY